MGLLMLVRHGQASFGADDYDVLSPTGWEQGRVLGRWLVAQGGLASGDAGRPAGVVHGGMRRHRETWAAIAEGARWPADGEAVHEDADWAEFDHLAVLARHAELTGAAVPHDADRRTFQAYFERATAHWTGAADGTYPESWTTFATRAARALHAAAERPGPTLVVTSGGVIAALAASLVLPAAADLGATWARFNTVVVNSAVTRVIVGPTGARLLTFNEHPHLPRELVTYR